MTDTAAEKGLLDQLELAVGYHASWLSAVETLRKCFAAQRAELERLHTWAGLMSLLDEHYPADVPLGPDNDPGPRILRLTRELDRLRGIERAARRAIPGNRALVIAEGFEDLREALYVDIAVARATDRVDNLRRLAEIDALARAHEDGSS
jgi:hypothetical protein